MSKPKTHDAGSLSAWVQDQYNRDFPSLTPGRAAAIDAVLDELAVSQDRIARLVKVAEAGEVLYDAVMLGRDDSEPLTGFHRALNALQPGDLSAPSSPPEEQ